MKIIILIISFLCSFWACSQDNSITNSLYPFEYPFRLKETKNNSSYQLRQSKNDSISISIKDLNGEVAMFINLKLINLKTKEVQYLYTDINGNVIFKCLNGKYKLEIDAIQYREFKLKYKIEANKSIKVDISLDFPIDNTVYEVHSKIKLSHLKVKKIRNCFEQNDVNGKCSENKNYFISIQI